MSALDCALLLGEIHYLIVSSCLAASAKWLTPKEVYEKTNIDPIDMHHALAELRNIGAITIAQGSICVAQRLPQEVEEYLK